MGLFRRPTPMNPAEIERMKGELRSLREALDRRVASALEVESKVNALHDRHAPADPAGRLDELTAKLAELDARVTAVSTELANQLTELGHDIDGLHDRPPGSPPDESALLEIRDGQERLANEQARYQIAFREDLARLAEQLKRRP